MTNDVLISHLKNSGQFALSPEQQSAMRQRVMEAYLHQLAAPQQSGPSRAWLIPRPLMAGLVAGVVILAGFGMSVAANAAKPGDALFGLDRAAEKIRLGLTISDTAKANYAVSIADERFREQQDLAERESPHTEEAETEAHQALAQALSTVTTVAQEHQQRGKGSDALRRAAEHLRELQQQQDAFIEAKAEIRSGQTKVEVEARDHHWEFTTSAQTFDDIVAAIVAQTGLDESNVRATLVIHHQEDQDRKTDQKTERSQSQKSTPPTNRSVTNNQKTEDTPDERHETEVENSDLEASSEEEHGINTTIRVRVHAEDLETEIRTDVNGVEDEWKIPTVLESEILTSLVTRTGLSAAAIQAVWNYSVQD